MQQIFVQPPEFWAGMAVGAFVMLALLALAVLVIHVAEQISRPEEDEPDLGSVMPPEQPRSAQRLERRTSDRIHFTPDPLHAARVTLSARQRNALRASGY